MQVEINYTFFLLNKSAVVHGIAFAAVGLYMCFRGVNWLHYVILDRGTIIRGPTDVRLINGYLFLYSRAYSITYDLTRTL